MRGTMESKALHSKIRVASPSEVEYGDRLKITRHYKIIKKVRLTDNNTWDWRLITSADGQTHQFQFCDGDLVILADDE